jgi:hypothetical protein
MQNAVMRAGIAALKNEPPILIEDESSPSEGKRGI